jgi:hypothetical protein
MDTNESTTRIGQEREARSRCLVDGCPCQDARIVSHRRARFFAHLAETNGETASRLIRPEPGWELPRTVWESDMGDLQSGRGQDPESGVVKR